MPIYEYRCHDCRRRVSLFFRSFSDIEDGTGLPPLRRREPDPPHLAGGGRPL